MTAGSAHSEPAVKRPPQRRIICWLSRPTHRALRRRSPRHAPFVAPCRLGRAERACSESHRTWLQNACPAAPPSRRYGAPVRCRTSAGSPHSEPSFGRDDTIGAMAWVRHILFARLRRTRCAHGERRRGASAWCTQRRPIDYAGGPNVLPLLLLRSSTPLRSTFPSPSSRAAARAWPRSSRARSSSPGSRRVSHDNTRDEGAEHDENKERPAQAHGSPPYGAGGRACRAAIAASSARLATESFR